MYIKISHEMELIWVGWYKIWITEIILTEILTGSSPPDIIVVGSGSGIGIVVPSGTMGAAFVGAAGAVAGNK